MFYIKITFIHVKKKNNGLVFLELAKRVGPPCPFWPVKKSGSKNIHTPILEWVGRPKWPDSPKPTKE